MKKIITVALLLTTAFTWAQNTKPATKPAVKPVTQTKPALAPQPLLKNMNDSVSYAIGASVANFYREQGITNINSAIVTAAVKDIMSGKQAKLDNQTCNMVINKALTQGQENKAQVNIEAGKAFLAQNKKKPGVKITASGLQYEVITEGTGLKPAAADTFVCHYRGTLINGTEFDASYNRGEPLKLGVGQVIRGWTEGLQLMGIGSKYKFYIPYDLAYGPYDNGQIPGGSVLIFDVELLDVKQAGHQ
jgi:FKBP-type peptidyl-prolyl cis-trans isomerase FklB